MNTPAPKAWFLGPKAENQEYFEHMLLEAFRDYCYWRRNFHPEDQAYIRAEDRLQAEYLQYQENLHDHLFEMLSHLKKSMPFFSPRYLGHMCKDLLMPGTLGYIAAMFYNQNNITQEAATITTRFEAEALQTIAQMLGYDLQKAWGHLCSGGTVANIEALWVARNLKLFPWQLALSHARSGPEQQAELKTLCQEFEIQQQALKTVSIAQSLQLFEALNAQGSTTLLATLQQNSLIHLGLQGFYQACEQRLGSAPPQLRIAYSQNAHYSLKKSLNLLGLGETAALKIPLNSQLRMDIEALEHRLQTLPQDQMVMAVVGVYGSTEEGAIDDFDRLLALKQQAQNTGAGDFWLHGDACYGGYALSLMAREEAEMAAAASLQNFMQTFAHKAQERSGEQHFLAWDLDRCQRWLKVSNALSHCDSISLDPHKLGYLPYPAGSVIYQDYRVREFIRCDAPYINAQDQATENYWHTPYPGKYTLEGSRPGATSAAVWLAHQTVPLNRQGHGQLVAGTLVSCKHLELILKEEIEKALPGIQCRFITSNPDLNILCYTFTGQWQGQNLSLRRCNQLIEQLYQQFLARERLPQQTQDFILSMTRLQAESYGREQLNVYWQKLSPQDSSKIIAAGESGNHGDDDYLALIRTVVMDPFFSEAVTRPELQGQSTSLARVFAQRLAHMLQGLLNNVA